MGGTTAKVVVGVLLLVIVILALAEADSGPRESSSGTILVSSSSPVEAKLAAIDEGRTLVPRDLPRAYGSVLNELDEKCREDRSRIGDMAVRATELLEEDGVDMSVLRMLNAMAGSVPDEAAGIVDCADVAGILATVIER